MTRSQMLQKISFATSFMYLKLRQGHKEDFMKVGGRWGLDYRIIKKLIMCFLRMVMPSRGITSDISKNY